MAASFLPAHRRKDTRGANVLPRFGRNKGDFSLNVGGTTKYVSTYSRPMIAELQL